MKEIRAIVKAYQSIDFSKKRAALATVVRVEGSSYRRAGARMLVLDDGTYLGGISGGCLEGDALRRAQKGIALQRSSVITYDTTQEDDHQIGVGLGCNGIIDVLFTPIHPDDPNPVSQLSHLITIREPAIVVSVSECPEQWNALGKTVVYENEQQFRESFVPGQISSEVLQDIMECRMRQQSQTISYWLGTGTINGGTDTIDARTGTIDGGTTAIDGGITAIDTGAGTVKVFIEVILPATHIVIYGGGYDIHPLVRMAGELGWDCTVVMNMARADKSLMSTATRVLHHNGEANPVIDAYTAVLLMSHDYKTDMVNLQKTLPTDTSYIGLLGPRKRAEKMMEALAGEGMPVREHHSSRIYAPAGLDIGAATPEEIALSILAEIRSHFAGRQGMSLRLREGKINGS